MKKRLLITSALMTAVLGASLATGTYAWYAVSNTQATMTKVTSNNLSSSVGASVSAAGLNGVFGTFTPLQLTDDNGASYYISGKKVYENESADVEGENTFTLSWATEDAAQKTAAAGSYVLTLKGSANVALASTENGTVRVEDGLKGGNSITYNVTIASDGTISPSTVTFYYAIRATDQDTDNTKDHTAESNHASDSVTAEWAAA